MVFSPHCKENTTVISLSRKLFSLVLLMVLMGATVSYIALTNSLATKGYAIKELQQELARLELEVQKMDMDVVSLQSDKVLEPGSLPEGFVAVERLEYLSSTPQVGVAIK